MSPEYRVQKKKVSISQTCREDTTQLQRDAMTTDRGRLNMTAGQLIAFKSSTLLNDASYPPNFVSKVPTRVLHSN